MQRVLVVDDDHLVADTLTLIFGKNGFEATAAYSADQGLERAREFSPDLLLCDVNMPGRDGLALASDLTKEQPSCRIIMLTGFYSNLKSIREHFSRLARPVGILSKPCHPSEIIREATAMLAIA
jgi:CheY-like chemotaxis protein